MAIFTKTKKTAKETVVTKATAETLGLEIDNLTKTFTTMATKLTAKANEARTIREAKEAEIAALQTECSNLEAVGNRAATMAEKITNLFS